MRDYNVRISENGRIIIPAPFRRELNIKSGDEVILTLSKDNDIIIHSPNQSLQKLQNLVTSKRKKSLVNGLIKMRRSEDI